MRRRGECRHEVKWRRREAKGRRYGIRIGNTVREGEQNKELVECTLKIKLY